MNVPVRSFLVDGARPKKTPFRRMNLGELNTGARHKRGGIHEAVRVSACRRLTKVLGGHLQMKDHCQVGWLVYNERQDTCQHSLILGWLGRGQQFTMSINTGLGRPRSSKSKTSTCLRSASLKDRLEDSLLHLFRWDTFPF